MTAHTVSLTYRQSLVMFHCLPGASYSAWILVLVLLLSAIRGLAQPQALLDQVRVTPLSDSASCYPGTAGTDHTIFLRADQQRTDCDIFGGRTPCLARREFPNDGPNGRPISLEAVVILRPSVSGDGRSVYFTQFGFNFCGMNTAEERNEGCFGRDALGFDPHSVAVSPSGNHLAVTVLNPDNQFLPNNVIVVGDAFTLTLLEQHVVQTSEPGGTALQLETVDFTVNGRYLIVDALNPVSGLWGIYAVDRTTGQTRTVVAPVPGLHIRNPALGQTSDDFLTFDVQDPQTSANTVFAANLLSGILSPVASTQTLGYPSFTGDDSAIVFTDVDGSTESQVSLDIQPLAADHITPAPGQARLPWLTDGGVGAIYRRGTFDGTLLEPSLCPSGQPPGNVSCNGDVNGDGQITPADTLRILQCFLGRRDCSQTEVERGNINRDQGLSPVDARCIFRQFLHFTPVAECACFLEP